MSDRPLTFRLGWPGTASDQLAIVQRISLFPMEHGAGCAHIGWRGRLFSGGISRCASILPERKQARPVRRRARRYSTMTMTSNWFVWAVLSAVFAALTAIFAKIGLEGVDSDLATLIRTVVIMAVLAAFVYLTGKWSDPFELSSKTWIFLDIMAVS